MVQATHVHVFAQGRDAICVGGIDSVWGCAGMYVVTDLTRFSPGNPEVCTALVHIATGECVRPMPYFAYSLVRKAGVLPGAIFTGQFFPKAQRVAPHFEDCRYEGLKYHGPARRDQFLSVLKSNLAPSVSAGLGYNFGPGEKVIPRDKPGGRSIVTIQVRPNDIEIVSSGFQDQKIKVHFVDSNGDRFRFMPITDLGFWDHARSHRDDNTLAELNDHLHGADQVLLRIGLSRPYRAPDGRDGYWVQVNGIYTFPAKLALVRGYES